MDPDEIEVGKIDVVTRKSHCFHSRTTKLLQNEILKMIQVTWRSLKIKGVLLGVAFSNKFKHPPQSWK